MGVSIHQPQKTKINVYLQDGRVYSYFVSSPIKAREHAHQIIMTGWRNVDSGIMEYYPVHQVLKVTFEDPKDLLSEK